MILDDFAKHAIVYFLTLIVVAVGAYVHAPSDILSPLSQGLGLALPIMLGGHAAVLGAQAWRGGDDQAVQEAPAVPAQAK